MSDKIYLVKAIEAGVSADDAFDYIVGYTTSYEEAEAACKKLKAENEQAHEFWNKHGLNCNVECEAWPTADDPKAIAALTKECKRNKCPYAELELKEVIFSNKSAGFEIHCKNKCNKCYCPTEYNYVIEEVEKL